MHMQTYMQVNKQCPLRDTGQPKRRQSHGIQKPSINNHNDEGPKYFPHPAITCRGYFMHGISSSRSKIEASPSPTGTAPLANDIQQQPTRPVEISVISHDGYMTRKT